MVRVSVSELTTFAACRKKHSWRYEKKLEKAGEPDTKLVAGTAVHLAVQRAVAARDGRTIGEHLIDALQGLVDEGRVTAGAATKTYPLALKFAQKFPEAYLTSESLIAEYPIEWDTGLLVGDEAVWLWGIPDLVRLTDGGIELLELKTTSNAYKHPLDFILWNPQHRYYALMLQEADPTLLISVRYIVLGPKVPVEQEFLFTSRAAELTKREVYGIMGEKLKSGVSYPNYGSQCAWCDFKELCQAEIVGQSVESVVMQSYKEREVRNV